MAATNGVYQCNEWQYCVRQAAEKGLEIFTSTYARHVASLPKEEGTKRCEILHHVAVAALHKMPL
jgi:hypothetical protein